MFPRRTSLLEVYACVVDLSLQARSNVTVEDITVLGECYPPGRDSSLNLIVCLLCSSLC